VMVWLVVFRRPLIGLFGPKIYNDINPISTTYEQRRITIQSSKRGY